jgi:Flp pilus assembly protein TadD
VSQGEFEEALEGKGRWGGPISLFRTYLSTAASYVRIARRACGLGMPDVLAVYFELPDAASHLFARYAAPEQSAVSAEGRRRFSGTVEEVYRYQDELLGELIQLVGLGSAVFVVSDHGFRWGDRRPEEGDAVVVGRAHLWHEDDGILIAAGRGIRHGFRIEKASVLDVTPTLLRYLGAPTARDMDGSPLVDLFEPRWIEDSPARFVESYESNEQAGFDRREEWSAAARGFAEEQQQRLTGLGYLAKAGAPVEMRAARVGLLLKSGRLAEAEQELRALERQAPTDAGIRMTLAELYRKGQRSSLARKEYEAAVSLAPSDAEAACGLAEVVAEQGDLQASEGWCRIAIEEAGSYARAHLDLGHVLNLQHRPEEAKQEFEEALVLEPNSFQALYNLGVLAERGGRVEEAELRYRQATAAGPADPYSRMNLGVLLVRKGSQTEGLEFLSEAVRLAPGNGEVHYNLGTAYLTARMPVKAIEELEAAVRIDPDLRPAHFNLGRAQFGVGELLKALPEFEVATRLDVRDPEAHYAMALILAALGRVEPARASLRNAIASGGAEIVSRARREAVLTPIVRGVLQSEEAGESRPAAAPSR